MTDRDLFELMCYYYNSLFDGDTHLVEEAVKLMQKEGLVDEDGEWIDQEDKKIQSTTKQPDPEEYRYVISFHPYRSDKEYKDMELWLEAIGFDGEWFISQSFGDYFLYFEGSDHERDSSGDRLSIWKRNGADH
jgi:hypothetical protein